MQIIVKTNLSLDKIDIGKVSQIGFYNSGQKLQKQAQENAPYMTGKLKQSIGVDPGVITKKTKSIRIGPRKVVYAVIREFVNKKNPSRKFYMRRTHDIAGDVVQAEFEKAVKLVISKI